MKAKVRTFQSGCGDCIFLILEDEKSGESFHIMIDCGVFTPEIKAFVDHDLGLRIDMLIETHYDDDHIGGIRRWFEMDFPTDDFVREIWINDDVLIANRLDLNNTSPHAASIIDRNTYCVKDGE